MFQSPSLRGSGRFWFHIQKGGKNVPVSIPFIAGQWSLPVLGAVLFMLVLLFQSPSLRGSGRFV